MNDPRRRRCALSSITSCEWRDETFVERGFVETDVSALPQKKQELYNFRRRSVVLTKRL